jgi:hypothetical protein
LNEDGGDKNEEEQCVVEEVFKDVIFVGFQLTSVDFVKDLKQHKHVEEDGVVFACLFVPVSHSDRRGDSK